MKKYAIISINEPVPGTRIFQLKPVGAQVSPSLPGQWAFLHLLDAAGKSIDKRPYSIASIPSSNILEFCIEIVGGRFTSKLALLKVGDLLGVDDPQGHLVYNGQKKLAFIAGGCGISPVISILRYVDQHKITGSFILFYSARTSNSILYRRELETIQARNPSVRVVFTLTREQPAGWNGELGRVNKELIVKHLRSNSLPTAKDAADYNNWYLCGSMALIKDLRAALQELGVDPKNIGAEGWG